MFDLPAVQAAIRAQGFDGWLLYDFRGSNVLAQRVVGLSEKKLSRRWFYFVPATGEPRKLVHAIEPASLDDLPGKTKTVYRRWQELEAGVGALVTGAKRVAMEYSPRNGNPYIGRVDAGTVELVRSFGVDVQPSGDLMQQFEATWDADQEASHFEAAQGHRFGLRRRLGVHRRQGEGGRDDRARRAEADHGPLRGERLHDVQPADRRRRPALAATRTTSRPRRPTRPIKAGDFVLIDLWAKLDKPRAVYSDLTRVGYVGREVPEKYVRGVQHRGRGPRRGDHHA